MPGHQPQPIALGHRRHDQLRLAHREGVADTDSRAAAEWEISEAWASLRALGREALRVEALGLFPKGGMAMGDEAADDHVGLAPHAVAADFVLADGVARNRPRRRIKPHRLFDHHPGVSE